MEIKDYLSNINELEQSQQIVDKYLSSNPNNFEMINQKGLLYLKKTMEIDAQAESVRLSKEISNMDKIKMQQDLKNQKDEMYKVAHDWLEKAYTINNNNVDNVKMLFRVKKTLNMPITPEFEAKFNELMK